MSSKKERILNRCYYMLENVCRANINQNLIYKEEILVNLKMLNFYLKQLYDNELVTKKSWLVMKHC